MVSIFLTIGIVVGGALTVSGAAMLVKKCNKNLKKGQSYSNYVLENMPYSIQRPIENNYDLFLKEEFSKTTSKKRTDGFISSNHFNDFSM